MDIIIIGAGVVGLTAAIGLANQGYTIMVLDKGPIVCPQDARLFAITRATEDILKAYDVWSQVEAHMHPYTAMQVWDTHSAAEINWEASALGVANLGYMIPHPDLWQALWEKAQSMPNITMHGERHLSQVQRSAKGWVLVESDGTQWETSLLIGADGADSWVREALAFPFDSTHYGQMAIVATVDVEEAMPHTAYQRFCAAGPLAFLPRSDGLWSIVWSMPTLEARTRMALSDAAFEEYLWLESDQRLGACRLESPRVAFPLRALSAVLYREHAVLIGDAAHTVHPLAGQGVNIGLYDAAHLAAVLGKAKRYHIPLGDETVLAAYQRQVYLYHQALQWGIAGIKTLFESTHPVIAWARSMGMDGVEALPIVKKLIAHAALGRFAFPG